MVRALQYCKETAGEMVNGLATKEYLMNKLGNVRKLNRTFTPPEYTRSCCAFYSVKKCIERNFFSHCILIADADKELNTYLKFFVKALKLFECNESACNGSLGVCYGRLGALFFVFILRGLILIKI